MRAALLSIALLAPACAALASSACTSAVVSITVETGADQARQVIALESGVSFAMVAGGAASREIMGIVSLAMVQQQHLTVRFAADGVDCNRMALRTDLVAVALGREPPPATTTTSPPGPATPVTK